MGFLHKNLPFEFLISRFSFLQGLLHWIAGVALMYIGNAPAAGGKASTKMFYFIGTSLMSALLLMIAFLNKHMNFYASYLHMIADFHLQFFQQYFLCTPVRKSNPRIDRPRHRRDFRSGARPSARWRGSRLRSSRSRASTSMRPLWPKTMTRTTGNASE